MPIRIKGKIYKPAERQNPKSAFSTFRYKKTVGGKAYILMGKFKKPRKSKTGKIQRWGVYEILKPA
jgi:hypothetical protein